MPIILPILQDNHGPYIDFKVLRFRPQPSTTSNRPEVHAFGKGRQIVGTSLLHVGDAYTVSPTKHLDIYNPLEDYIVVYTLERRELWCSHGLIEGNGWNPHVPEEPRPYPRRKVTQRSADADKVVMVRGLPFTRALAAMTPNFRTWLWKNTEPPKLPQDTEGRSGLQQYLQYTDSTYVP